MLEAGYPEAVGLNQPLDWSEAVTVIAKEKDPTSERFHWLLEHIEQEWKEWLRVKAEAENRLSDLSEQRERITEAMVRYQARRRPEASPLAEVSETGEPRRFESISLADACEILLREAGRPLPAGEIMTIALKNGARTSSTTPYNVIVTAMQRDKRFIRLRPGLWGLSGRDDKSPTMTAVG